ncbi:MAG: DUF4465 domain-containing protein [Prevotellaceae bacterium]|jgi:hypothetical protein|nr:DUF4465 domain-containing protein [Prevotellaceae bacterium]
MRKENSFKALLLVMMTVTVNNLFALPGDTIILNLNQPTNPESIAFDAQNGYWTGTFDTNYPIIEFGDFAFSHSGSGGYWNGFTVSNSGDNTDYGNGGNASWVPYQWGCMAGGGIKTDASGKVVKDASGKVETEQGIPYLVAYWGYFMESDEDHSLQTILYNSYEAVGVYVNNHPWPYYGNISGDGFARPFVEGDYLKLFIHGLNEDYESNGLVVEYTLAEFTNGQLIESPDWEWIDLSSLGTISGFYYTMESTDGSEWGPNTAVYFCLDKLQVRQPNTPPSIPTDLQAVATKTTIAFSWTASTDDGQITGYQVYLDDQLVETVTETSYLFEGLIPNTSYELGVVAIDNANALSGKATITQSTLNTVWISSVIGDKVVVYPNPFIDYIVVNIDSDSEAHPLVISDISGKTVLSVDVTAGANCINTSTLEKGVYLVRYGLNTAKVVK